MWKFARINTYNSPEEFVLEPKCVTFHGDFSLDDRGKFVESNLEHGVYIKYDEDNYNFIIAQGGCQKVVQTYELVDKILAGIESECIIIDATTLSFAEILYLLSVLNKIDEIDTIQVLYVEPSEYKFVNSSVVAYDEFSLSERLNKFPPLPGFTINAELENIDLIAFLGFEKQRLGQIFSQEEVIYENFTPIVPLPGFSPGWENRTINNHLKFFDPRYRFTELRYVSANNPYQTLKLLEKIASSGKSFRVAPIGTKPNAIGCAVFLVNNENNVSSANYGALYDFPVKSKDRSSGIGKIHVYSLTKVHQS